MVPTEPREWLDLLASRPPEVIELVRSLRRTALTEIPEFTERVYPMWEGLGLRHPKAGLVASLFARPTDAAAYFERGAQHPDPIRLLTGGDRLRRTRILEFPPPTGGRAGENWVLYLEMAIEQVKR